MLIVRQALRGVAETIELDEIELNDISTAVTEACNNVVQHAYSSATGALEVELRRAAGGLEVVVRDHGVGIAAGTGAHDGDEEEGGIGMPVMRALSQHVSFEELPAGGTEVRMSFASRGALPLDAPLGAEGVDALLRAREGVDDTISVWVGPATLARAVLRRVLAALAARARFSAERVTQTQLLADELAGKLAHDGLSAGISVAPRSLEMAVGPLRAGSSAGGPSAVLERLAESHDVVRSDAVAEVLAVRLVEPARSSA